MNEFDDTIDTIEIRISHFVIDFGVNYNALISQSGNNDEPTFVNNNLGHHWRLGIPLNFNVVSHDPNKRGIWHDKSLLFLNLEYRSSNHDVELEHQSYQDKFYYLGYGLMYKSNHSIRTTATLGRTWGERSNDVIQRGFGLNTSTAYVISLGEAGSISFGLNYFFSRNKINNKIINTNQFGIIMDFGIFHFYSKRELQKN